MMRRGKGSLLVLAMASVIAFALAGCCDSDTPLGIRESGAVGGAGPPALNLRTASTFGVLAGQGVTNTGLTVVTGDLGTFPNAAVTGFGPGVVQGGSIHAADAVAESAQAHLTLAYNDAAGLATGPVSVSGDLGGLTLTPGLYKSTSTLGLTGALTLNGLGNSDAVFIIQIASALTTATNSEIILTGGAQAKNIIWQVGSSATLGTNSVFKGTILALSSITLTTGAQLDGRALARNGTVTLDTNAIVAQ